ncbi:MAG: HAD family hydrolase [candidate division NC10 bacterium]|nr:HAD family hydrolase [candidate division NC10 bacterium]
MVQKIKTIAVVFDQGNTLIMDPFRKILERKKEEFRKRFEEYGISISAPSIVEAWTTANNEMDYPHIAHFLQEEPIIQRALARLQIAPRIALSLGLELLRVYREGYEQVVESDLRTEKVRSVLAQLKARGKRLGVFSNDRAATLGMTLQAMQIDSCFEYVETSESIGVEKPDLRVFEHILRCFQLPAHLVTYVGDDPSRDVEPAKASGLKAVLHSVDSELYGESWRNYRVTPSPPPDAIIGDFAELLEVIA